MSKTVEYDKSRSGRYKSVRHLLETLFANDKYLTKEEARVAVEIEFPEACYLNTKRTHFSWYKTHIVSHGEFTTIEPPMWAIVGIMPRIKPTKNK